MSLRVRNHVTGRLLFARHRWCAHASEYTAQVGGEPWSYLLIPHDEVSTSRAG